MTHSLCSTVTVFCGVEIVLSLLVLYHVLSRASHQCLTIHHDSALHLCQTNGSVSSAKHLAHDLFSSSHDQQDARHVLGSRLEGVESISCQERNPLEFSFESGPSHAVFFLPYFFVPNSLLCLLLFLRHRMVRLGNLFAFVESMLVTAFTGGALMIVLYFQHREHQWTISAAGDTRRGMSLHPPANWGTAVNLAWGTLAWKIVQLLFHTVTGDKKISIEQPIFKIFDFSKNYAPAETTET